MGNPNQRSVQLQLIDGKGTLNVAGFDNFIKQVKLDECGVSYAVVSIMGPQSSGKSTLLNHLFGTNFKEMNAYDGRSKTTKGIWLAHCVDIEPHTIVMDVEGTDGRERGQGDTNFERQSALFALAVSDIVLLNMWCTDIGREQAANRPLLMNVFQVMITLFNPRKVTLMFVIRDKSKTPLEKLDSDLRKDIQAIWDSVPKPQSHKQTLSDFFNVRVVAFSNYERDEDLFKKEVASLRQQFFHSIAPGRLAGDRRDVVPASGFSLSIKRIWGIIKENKDLNLPYHQVMVATVRCEEILKDKFARFSENKDWCQVKATVQSRPIPGFGEKLNSLLDSCLSEYNAETAFYVDGVRNAKRNELKAKLLQLVQSSYQSMLEHVRSRTLAEFKEAFVMDLKEQKHFSEAVNLNTESSMRQFDAQSADAFITLANWGASDVRDKLQSDIDLIVAHVTPIIQDAKNYKMFASVLVSGLYMGLMAVRLAIGDYSCALELLGLMGIDGLGAAAAAAGTGEACARLINKNAIKQATKAMERGSK